MQALADGIMDASLLLVYEKRWRDEPARSATWMQHQADKVTRGLAALEKADFRVPVDVDHVDIRPYRRRLRARLSRPALRRRVACRPSDARPLADGVCRRRAVLRSDPAAGLRGDETMSFAARAMSRRSPRS